MPFHRHDKEAPASWPTPIVVYFLKVATSCHASLSVYTLRNSVIAEELSGRKEIPVFDIL